MLSLNQSQNQKNPNLITKAIENSICELFFTIHKLYTKTSIAFESVLKMNKSLIENYDLTKFTFHLHINKLKKELENLCEDKLDLIIKSILMEMSICNSCERKDCNSCSKFDQRENKIVEIIKDNESLIDDYYENIKDIERLNSINFSFTGYKSIHNQILTEISSIFDKRNYEDRKDQNFINSILDKIDINPDPFFSTQDPEKKYMTNKRGKFQKIKKYPKINKNKKGNFFGKLY